MKPYGTKSDCKIAILIQQNVGSSSSYLPSLDLVQSSRVFLADITGSPTTKPEHFSWIHIILTMHTKVDVQIAQCAHGV